MTFMSETIFVPNSAANAAFNNMDERNRASEIPEIPGFYKAEVYGNAREARHGRYRALFLSTRIFDGKVFAAVYEESVDEDNLVESPFQPETGETEFRAVQRKERIVTEEYYDFL
jgi:hypothetical protein